HGSKLLLCEDRDPQFSRLPQLAAGVLTRHHIGGLLANAATGFAPPGLDKSCGLLPGKTDQRSGEDEGHSLELIPCRSLHRLHRDAGFPEPANQMLGLGTLQPSTDIPGSDRSHVVNSSEFLLRGSCEGVKGPEMGSQGFPC